VVLYLSKLSENLSIVRKTTGVPALYTDKLENAEPNEISPPCVLKRDAVAVIICALVPQNNTYVPIEVPPTANNATEDVALPSTDVRQHASDCMINLERPRGLYQRAGCNPRPWNCERNKHHMATFAQFATVLQG
jgi:hypothetical protein